MLEAIGTNDRSSLLLVTRTALLVKSLYSLAFTYLLILHNSSMTIWQEVPVPVECWSVWLCTVSSYLTVLFCQWWLLLRIALGTEVDDKQCPSTIGTTVGSVERTSGLSAHCNQPPTSRVVTTIICLLLHELIYCICFVKFWILT